MSDWQRAQIKINQHHMSYLRTGGDKPPIILLHGFTEDSSTWGELATALSTNYDLIMPDTIGHGESSRLPADRAIDPLQDLTGFIKALTLQKTALIGHSMGAAIAAEFTAQNPEKVAALVLEEVPWFDPASPLEIPQQAFAANNPAAIKKISASDLQEALSYSQEHHPSWNEVAHKAWAGSKIHFDAEWFKASWKPQINWEEIAEKIKCPTLIISGQAAYGGILSAAVAIKLLKIIPASEWSNIAGAGHFVHYDKPVPYIETVMEFLKRKYPVKKA
jgi:pimeloyl-ACP methyl ester carboxylesterase